MARDLVSAGTVANSIVACCVHQTFCGWSSKVAGAKCTLTNKPQLAANSHLVCNNLETALPWGEPSISHISWALNDSSACTEPMSRLRAPGGQSFADSGTLRQDEKSRIPIIFLPTFREFALFYDAQWTSYKYSNFHCFRDFAAFFGMTATRQSGAADVASI